MEEHILICEDSVDGIFTAVYRAYEKRYAPERTQIWISEEENLRLFAVYESVDTDKETSGKVVRTLKRRFGEKGFYTFCLALSTPDTGKATAVYRTLAKGLRLRRPSDIFYRHADPDVHKVESLQTRAGREMDHLRGFLRFCELEGRILYAEIGPENHILPYLADHFADRFPKEHFLILDTGRSLSAVHEAGKAWFLASADSFMRENLKERGGEALYRELFRCFHHKIAIEARRNENLQKNMLPLRFRPYMAEFTKEGDGRIS